MHGLQSGRSVRRCQPGWSAGSATLPSMWSNARFSSISTMTWSGRAGSGGRAVAAAVEGTCSVETPAGLSSSALGPKYLPGFTTKEMISPSASTFDSGTAPKSRCSPAL